MKETSGESFVRKRETSSDKNYSGIPNLLKDTPEEQANRLAFFVEKFRKFDLEDTREEFVKEYQSFVRSVIKDDNEDFSVIDPYEFVTGKKFEDMFKRSNERWLASEQTFAPYTLITSNNSLVDNNYSPAPEHIRFNISGNAKPLHFDSGAELGFGFISTKLEDDTTLAFGTLVLEDTVVSAVNSFPEFEKIHYKLQQLGVWFNHDVTAHATLMPEQSQRDYISVHWSMSKAQEFADFFYQRNFQYQDRSVFAGEFWSMSLQSDIYKRIVEQRPAVGRFMRMHLNTYMRDLEQLTSHISDRESRSDCFDYLQKAYAFMFLRLIDPELLLGQEAFTKMKENNPGFFEAPKDELAARENAHHAHGLKFEKDGIVGYIPHKELVTELAQPLEEMELFENGLLSIVKGEKSDDVADYIESSEYNRRMWFNFIIKNRPELKWVGFTREGRQELIEGPMLVDLARGEMSFEDFSKFIIDNYRR